MTNTDIQVSAQGGGALSAEHYQTFEMAKANDDVIGGEDLAQLRSYSAASRAQAQAVHKTIAMMQTFNGVAAAKAEAVESSQAWAKVGIYADERMGEIISSLPTKQGARMDITSSTTSEEVSKADALKSAGISNGMAYDLVKMAANPEVVEAVIAKAEAEGRIVSRNQVLDAIREKKLAEQERDTAKSNLAEAYRENEMLDAQVASLKRQVAERPEPEVVEVVREVKVVPDDYEETKRKADGLRRENERLNREYHEMWNEKLESDRKLEQANELLGERERNSGANRDVEQLINNIYTFLSRHGGKSRMFDQFYRVDETTQAECRKALVALGGFVQSALQMTEERKMIGAPE